MRLDSRRTLTAALAALVAAFGAPAVTAGAADPLPSPRATFHSVETPGFRVVGDLPPRRLAEIAERLEVFRAALARLKPRATAHTSVPTLVLAFPGERAFRPYLYLNGAKAEKYSGIFSPTRWGNYLVFDATAGEDPLDSVYTGYIYFFVVENYPATPLWLQKGLGEYYETFRATASTVEVGRPHQDHAQYLAQGWRIPLSRLIEVTREHPEYQDPDQIRVYSAHCWALVHYLLVGGEGIAPRVPDLLARLDRGEALDAALQASLGIGSAALEERLRLYTKQPLFHYQIWKTGELEIPAIGTPVELARPEALALLGEYLAHSDVPDAARAHLDAALAAEPDNGDALALLAYLAQEAGNTEEASALYARALAGRMRRAVSALHAGEFALERSRASVAGSAGAKDLLDAARAAARKALELDPESGEARLLEGRAALEAGDGVDAFVALSEAQGRLPGRADVVYDRYRAALAANQPVVARGILTGPLARLDPERAARELANLKQREQYDLANRVSQEADRAANQGLDEEALATLREGLAKATEPSAREYLSSRLTYLEGFIASRRRTEAYNHAVALVGERKYAASKKELEVLLAACPEGESVCDAARDLHGQLEKLVKGKR